MYLFQEDLIRQTIKEKSLSYFFNMNDKYWQREETIDSIKSLLKPYFTKKRMGLSKMSRSELGTLLEDFVREATAITQAYIEETMGNYGELIEANKQLWQDRFRADLGIEMNIRTDDYRGKTGNHWMTKRYGQVLHYDSIQIANENAPYHLFFKNDYIGIKHSSWGKYSSHCFERNHDGFNPLAGEHYYVQFHVNMNGYQFRSDLMSNDEGEKRWCPDSEERMRKTMMENEKKLQEYEQAKAWYQASCAWVESELESRFGDRYHAWRKEIPKTV